MYLFFMENNIYAIIVWLAIFLITIGIEFGTAELVSIWFSGAAFIALLLACFNVNWIVQVVVFVITAILLLVLSRPLLKKRLSTPEIATNADSLIDNEILITKKVSRETPGEGKIRDVVWTCKTDDEVPIESGAFAIIKELRGNALIVRKKGE